MEAVSVGYEPGKRGPVAQLDLRIDADDRIALLGANGNGKSTFAKLIAGRLAPLAGKLRRPHRLEVAYFAQHQLDDLDPEENPYRACPRLMPDAPEARCARGSAASASAEKMNTPAGPVRRREGAAC